MPAPQTYDHYSDIQDIAFSKLQALLPETSATLLDIGCGTGKNTAYLKMHYPNAHVIGIDPKPGMIAHAKTIYTDIEFDKTTLENYTPPQKQFDLILSNATLHWCQDWQIISQKLADLSTDTGRVLFSYFGPNTFKELNHCLKAISNDSWATSADAFTPYLKVEPYLKKKFKSVTAYTIQITETHDTVMDLLKKIKATQVNTPQTNKPFILTKKHLDALTEKYMNRYGRIDSTYEITIVTLKKCA